MNYTCREECRLHKNQHRRQLNSGKHAWHRMFYCKNSVYIVCVCVCVYTYNFFRIHICYDIRCMRVCREEGIITSNSLTEWLQGRFLNRYHLCGVMCVFKIKFLWRVNVRRNYSIYKILLPTCFIIWQPHIVCMYVYVPMHVFMYVCICVCMCVCMHACMHACIYVCVYACRFVCMCVCMCVYVAEDVPKSTKRRSCPVEGKQHYTTQLAYSCHHWYPSTSK